MNDNETLDEKLERLQGEINGLRAVSEALVQSLLSGPALGHSEQKVAFLSHLRRILDRFNPPSSLSSFNPRSAAMLKILQEFSGKVSD